MNSDNMYLYCTVLVMKEAQFTPAQWQNMHQHRKKIHNNY